MGYNSARYIHTLYQAMNLAFADRDFYYGDPYVPPVEPIKGLLSKEYARERFARDQLAAATSRSCGPAIRIRFKGRRTPIASCSSIGARGSRSAARAANEAEPQLTHDEAFLAGTTSIQAADAEGWVVSITPSGGWVPAFIAGQHGRRPVAAHAELRARPRRSIRTTCSRPANGRARRLSPSMALRDGKPFLSFAVQGGDAQDQNLLQFFLNMVEFKMSVQQAAEAANVNSYQMQNSFGEHTSEPGRLVVRNDTPTWVQASSRGMGYRIEGWERTSGPINAIFIDRANGSLWGGSSDFGEDYGVAW